MKSKCSQNAVKTFQYCLVLFKFILIRSILDQVSGPICHLFQSLQFFHHQEGQKWLVIIGLVFPPPGEVGNPISWCETTHSTPVAQWEILLQFNLLLMSYRHFGFISRKKLEHFLSISKELKNEKFFLDCKSIF